MNLQIHVRSHGPVLIHQQYVFSICNFHRGGLPADLLDNPSRHRGPRHACQKGQVGGVQFIQVGLVPSLPSAAQNSLNFSSFNLLAAVKVNFIPRAPPTGFAQPRNFNDVAYKHSATPQYTDAIQAHKSGAHRPFEFVSRQCVPPPTLISSLRPRPTPLLLPVASKQTVRQLSAGGG